MTRFSLLFSLGLAMAASASASSLCVTDTLANYRLAGATPCKIGGIEFSNFKDNFNPVAFGGQFNDSNIIITPFTTTGFQGFNWDSTVPLTNPPSSAVYNFKYDLQPLFGDVTGTLNSLIVFGSNGSADSLSNNYVTPTSEGANLVNLGNSYNNVQTFTSSHPGSATFTNTFLIASGDVVSGGVNSFGASTPEPMSYVLFGSGLVAISLLRKKIKA